MRQAYAHNFRHQGQGNRAIEFPVLQSGGASDLTSRDKSARFKLLLEPPLDAVYNYARRSSRTCRGDRGAPQRVPGTTDPQGNGGFLLQRDWDFAGDTDWDGHVTPGARP
jgi:hypothetical protein